MSERRTALVKKAFQILDKDGSGTLTLADIVGKYDAKKHPKVVAGEMTEDQVLQEFLEGFEGDHLGGKVEGEHDGTITWDEFVRYTEVL
jgi:Ca2+-binding EF-hand superfamily protein